MAHTQERSGVRTRIGQAPRHGSSKKDTAQGSSPYHAGHGFLKHRFLPLAEIPAEVKNRKQIEAAYFQSLQNLATLYKLMPLDVSEKPYPYNIYLSYLHTVEQLKKIEPKLQLIIVQDEKHKACLATVKVFNTGAILYYLPVRPLYDLLWNNKRKKEAQLLLSVFAYLYRVVRIPHYAYDNDFLQCQYEMIEQWLTEEPDSWEADEYESCLSQIKAAKHFGERLLRQIRHKYHLELFEKRVLEFIPFGEIQKQLQDCSKKMLQLYQTYPKTPFYIHIEDGLLAPDVEDRISPDQYLSFIWDNKGWLFEQLSQQVNCALQEMMEVDEPVSLQYFDQPQEQANHDLEIENQLFSLLDELAYILNNVV